MLWEAVEGKRSEDLATEVLAFIFQSQSFAPLQKLIYQWLLADGAARSTVERGFDVTTQESHPGQGRLDLTIRGDEVRIIVESKFDADFSQGDQLRRYVSILRGFDEKLRILAILCPERNRLFYEAHSLQQFYTDLGQVDALPGLECELSSRYGIVLKFLTWDHLLTLLECDSVLVAELIEFVRNRALTPVEFLAKELSMIMSDQIPNILISVFAAIDQVRGRLVADFVGGRMSQSREWYGFNVDHHGLRFWFGYSLRHWSRIKTPFLLQFNSSWTPANLQVSEERLLTLGFIKDEGVVCPLALSEADTDQVLSLVTQVREKITQVLQSAVIET